jgi:hypothetical protein
MMPSPWLHHLWNLLVRSWSSLVSYLGTTTFGILFSLVLMGCTLAYSFHSTLRKNHATVTLAALKDAAHQAFRPMLASMAIILIGWLSLLSVFVARTVYEDHETLVAVNKRLLVEAQNKTSQSPNEAKDPARKLELALPPLLEKYLLNRAKEDAGYDSQRIAVLSELPTGAKTVSFTQRTVASKHPECPFNIQVVIPKLYSDTLPAVLMIECQTGVGRIETTKPTADIGRIDDRNRTVGFVDLPLEISKLVMVNIESRQRNRVLRVSQSLMPP